MSLTSQIGSSDSAFKLSQKLVSSLAEKFGFKFEKGEEGFGDMERVANKQV